MAAYAGLVSLMHIIEQIQHHPHPPISLDKKQVESLIENVTFLQDFLERYSSHGGGGEDVDALESRIANAAYAAEDIVESHIVDQILGRGCTIHGESVISSIDFCKSLQKVIEEMDFIKEDLLHVEIENLHMLHKNAISSDSLRSQYSTGQNAMVGFDDVLNVIMDKLTGQRSTREIIPIVGMGGIGKTTLARNIYAHRLIMQHFDILAWVTISQEYNMKAILLQLLLCVKGQESQKTLSGMSGDELGIVLHKSLIARRYLIIMDDMWSIDAWDMVKFFFPDNNNGSRIIVTTRLSIVASQLTDSHGIELSFLDDELSWKLLCKNVFGEEVCPLELEEIGKKIAKNCKGLPLSIVVIGGLLAKSEHTRVYWEYVVENLTSIVNLEDNERCLKILHMSYGQLPVHLKPCFLYMGVFLEDDKIRVSRLIKLWVAEGFLKPISGKSLELVAEEYLTDLMERNLIQVHTYGSSGKIKLCNIHDLIRDLCLRQVEKEKFLCVTKQCSLNIPHIDTQRRICIHRSTSREEYLPQVANTLQSALLARSLICDFKEVLPSLNSRLLRVLKADDRALYYEDEHSLEVIFQLVNSRYLAITMDFLLISKYLSSVYLVWNLQTLIVFGAWNTSAPSEIWKMPQLRHIEFVMLDLPDPPQMDGTDGIVLGNLQTLLLIRNFKCGEEVVKRIPNVKKLQIYYEELEGLSRYGLNNLGRLDKLESLYCSFMVGKGQINRSELLQNLSFPQSLKKLSLDGTELRWEDMAKKIGSLPLLQVLKLLKNSFRGAEWETVDDQFCRLKFLLIDDCDDLKYWTTESSHFPCLERLVLRGLDQLEEIPWGIGEIPTLQSIVLKHCSDSAIISAKDILEEQEEYGNVGLQVRVHCWEGDQLPCSSTSPNFQVEID